MRHQPDRCTVTQFEACSGRQASRLRPQTSHLDAHRGQIHAGGRGCPTLEEADAEPSTAAPDLQNRWRRLGRVDSEGVEQALRHGVEHWPGSIRGSLAHARMLARCNIIPAADLRKIEKGLAQISSEIAAGDFAWSLDAEDVHLNIERRLTELIGDAGKRLHTARSRNDQVATDIRLWLRDETDAIICLLYTSPSPRD